jgi:hypothetical protein
LVELDGGKWGLVAQCQPLASPRSFRATVVPLGHAGEGESEQGEVGAWSLCRLGSGGGVVVVLNAGWGCLTAEREEKRNGEDLPKIFSGSSHPLCPGATGQGLGLGCERGKREKEW